MPYTNIVFAKLEKRLLDDYRWYMMSEFSQLNYIKLILLAAATYNKIPKSHEALKLGLKTIKDVSLIAESIIEIKANFPKFRETKHFYYFADFQEKTNYIPTKAIPRKSQVSPKEATDKEYIKKSRVYKEEVYKEEKDKEVVFSFEDIYSKYPNKDGRKMAEKHFKTSVKTYEDWNNINRALENYLKNDSVKNGFIKNASTWFNNWQDWIDFKGIEKPKQKSFPDINKICEKLLGKHAPTKTIVALLKDIPEKYWGVVSSFLRKRYPNDGTTAFAKAESEVLRGKH